METNPVIKSITIYPVKSLDGILLQKAQISNGGCLLHDREYAIFDSNGKYVKGKSNEQVHLLRSEIDFENEIISFRHQQEINWNQFHLQNNKMEIDEYLSAFFKKPVTLVKNSEGKFLDEPVVSGMTVVSSGSLNTVSSWFNNMPLDETRKRFRATIEIENCTSFWEDRLFYKDKLAVEFKMGNTLLYGMSPRARCVVPTRHPETGDMIHAFQKTFANLRIATLPAWSVLNEYNHSYYLSVDCYVPPSEFGKWITVGDEVVITGKKHKLEE
jgi:uncharacterized protein